MSVTGTAVTVDMSVTGNCLESDVRVLFSSPARPPHLIVFGAVDFAHALIRSAKVLGYRVTLCDARPVFATPERFPEADEVVTMWPHEYLETQEISASTFICVLTHDPKFDVPALTVALRSGAGYVGAMGSRRTHHDRLGRLRAAGVTDTELTGLSSPIGLDLGAATPRRPRSPSSARSSPHAAAAPDALSGRSTARSTGRPPSSPRFPRSPRAERTHTLFGPRGFGTACPGDVLARQGPGRLRYARRPAGCQSRDDRDITLCIRRLLRAPVEGCWTTGWRRTFRTTESLQDSRLG
ncbi:XdhC family protein [Gordonia paraffinivorans]|uniref:XdhC family protein n=1 Tax=Gordonia paraffinivorans TaxID=175628 RepID=UPI0035E3F134